MNSEGVGLIKKSVIANWNKQIFWDLSTRILTLDRLDKRQDIKTREVMSHCLLICCCSLQFPLPSGKWERGEISDDAPIRAIDNSII
jgi:hypothetical protein